MEILMAFAVVFLFVMLFSFVLAIIGIIALYKTFEKAGVEGWKAIIPFYNYYVMTKDVAKIEEFWFFLLLLAIVPVIGQLIAAVAMFNIHYSVVRRFSEASDIRVLGTIFFPIYVLFSGFGNLKYDNSEMSRNGFFQDSTIDNIRGGSGKYTGSTNSTSSSSSTSSKFCKNCGNKVNENDKFCQSCGNKL